LTLYLSLMIGFGVLALALSSTGTYSVFSYVTASRLREFAIRAALGADRGRVARLVLVQGLRLTAFAVVVGGLAVVAAAPLLQYSPIHLQPPNVATVTIVAALLAMLALVACWLPARRAADADLTTMLRIEY